MNRRTRAVAVLVNATFLIFPAVTFAAFEQDLRQGASGSAVVELQQFLVARGHLSSNGVTGFFGPLTLAAVRSFQSHERIEPAFGFFGPLTRAKARTIDGTLTASRLPERDLNGGSACQVELGAKIEVLTSRISWLQEQLAQAGRAEEQAQTLITAEPAQSQPAPGIAVQSITTKGGEFTVKKIDGNARSVEAIFNLWWWCPNYVVDWGDGTPIDTVPREPVCKELGGRKTMKVLVSHTYKTGGPFKIALTRDGTLDIAEIMIKD